MIRTQIAFSAKLDRYMSLLSRRFPEIRPHDLRLILHSLLKPKSWPRRFLLRKAGKDRYVF